jgi:hypothetical protein
MNRSLKQAVAIAVCLCLINQHSTQAQIFSRGQSSQKTPAATTKKKSVVKKDSAVKQAISAMEGSSKRDAATELVDYNTFENLETSDFDGGPCWESDPCNCGPGEMCCDDCCGSGSCGGQGLLSRPGQIFFVGEYIYARPCLSEALAYVISDSNQPLQGQQNIEFDFDYQSSYRLSGGYRFCDCGGEIVFSYARYRGEAAFDVQDTSASPAVTIFGPYEVNAPGNGGFLSGDADIDLKSYDLGVSKTIPLGGPFGCCNSCGDTCCDTCCDDTCCDPCCGSGCCGWCPAWDFTFSAGVRFADAAWSKTLNSFENDLDRLRESVTQLNFEGAGARIGILGRRYFGCSGCVSAYAKGDISILVGDMDIRTDFTDFSGTSEDEITLTGTIHRNSGCRVVPVTEIEAGLEGRLGKHVTLSSGYFLSAWHDLGFRDEYNFGGNFQLLSYDDANILGFDGFFARAEVAF